MRRRSDKLYPRASGGPARRLGPREEEATRIVAERPGITVEELAEALGVGMKRVWQMIERLEFADRLRRDGEPPKRPGPPVRYRLLQELSHCDERCSFGKQ